MNSLKLFLSFLVVSAGYAQYPDGNEILKKIDNNMSARSKIVQSRMVIHGARGSRTVVSKSWIEGVDRSFTEYLAPPREKGTKMLKLEDQLWTYSPQTDRTIRIAGHLLRQSVMGSDLSYEDYMEDPEMSNIYDATVIAETQIEDRECWVLDLVAQEENVAYYKRKLWVDKTRFVPLKEELYSKSDKLLKNLIIKKVERLEDRWYPSHMIFKDVMKSGEGTEFIVDSIELDVSISPYIFSKAALRK
jgi:outer membrane lipoprotein-sorting protein